MTTQGSTCFSVLYSSVFKEIEKLLTRNTPLVIAIDGLSGSGKSTLAEMIEANYACPVISMDHFFLTPEQKTAERLKEYGGNIDYERFSLEVTPNLKSNNSFSYGIYDCQKDAIASKNIIEPHRLTVVEGSYSHHPKLLANYDLKIFLTIPSQVQRERLLQRNGPKMLERFIGEWIPLENAYFSALRILESSDLVINTHNHNLKGNNGNK